jgi:hypothetical protein
MKGKWTYVQNFTSPPIEMTNFKKDFSTLPLRLLRPKPPPIQDQWRPCTFCFLRFSTQTIDEHLLPKRI